MLTANKAVVMNPSGTGMTVTAGSLALAADLTVSNALTFTGVNGSSVNFGAGGTVLYSGGAGFVASIAGTANEITASAATGAVVLSLPTALTFTGKTVTGGTLSGVTINAGVNTLTNITTTMFAANVFDTDPTLAANSTTRIPAQSAVKSYVDNAITGLTWKPAMQAATTGALPTYVYANGASGVGATITAVGNGALTAQDGVTLTVNQRLLVKNETAGNAPYNGLYAVTQVGSVVLPFILTRVTDADTSTELWGSAVLVEAGTVNANTQWTNSNATAPTIGTTAITFSQISGAGTYTATGGITLTGNQFSLDTTVISIASGKKLTVSNTLTLAGTDATTMTFPTTSAAIARTDAANTFTGVQTFSTPIASASMAVMTATVGGRVPTPPNNTTTFLRGDGTFAGATGAQVYNGPYIGAGTYTFTTPAGTTTATIYRYRLQAPGGGSAGNNAGDAFFGTEGGSGGQYSEGTFTGIAAGVVVTIVIGVVGSAGTSAPTAGGNGGNVVLSATGISTITCHGGTGGRVATVTQFTGAVASVAASGAQIDIPGRDGGTTALVAGSGNAGIGGASHLGYGGEASQTAATSNGRAGTGYGGGASGSRNAGNVGATGAPGWAVVEQITP